MENLEGRRLLAAAPAGVEAVPVVWDGQEHLARPGSFVAGFADVRGNAGEQLKAVNALLARAGGERITATRHLGSDGVFQLEAPGAARAAEVRRAVGRLPGVEFVEPDFVLTSQATTPNDSYFAAHQWALDNTGQTGGTADADIDAPEAWDLARDGSSVVVGVIDSGVDYGHSDLAANVWTNPGEVAGDGADNDGNGYVDDVRGWDFFNRDNDPMDDNGHGTHVAGTIAAAGDNGLGVAGVTWAAKVVPLKFLGADGSGYLSDAVAAVNYATDLRAKGVNLRVTNNSWGGGGYSTALFDAIKRHGDAGILFVAAAGNSGADNDATASYPSNYDLPNVVAVAATDHKDALPSFSNYGATQVDLAAPGVSILSTTRGGGYGFKSGTSMAAPHVSGTAALAWAYSPTATVAGVRDALLGGADRVSALSGKVATGGRLNVFNTLGRLGFGVAGSSPADGATLSTRPTDFVVDFTSAYAGGSVQASDFAVNGVAANSVVFDDADTLTFRYTTSPVSSASGTQTMRIASGAIIAASGNLLPAWSASFAYVAPVTGSVPAAPANLTAKAVSRRQVALTWEDRSGDETGFQVEVSSDGGRTFSRLGTVAADVTGVTVGGLKSNRTYHFRVCAVNDAGSSGYSNVASARTFK